MIGVLTVFLKALVWQSAKNQTQEYFKLVQTADGYLLKGSVIVSNHSPVMVNYRIECDIDWKTRSAQVEKEIAGKKEILQLVNQNSAWFVGMTALPYFAGLDVDFDFSPATNTIPIRRLNLSLGESKVVESLWVRLEGLKREKLVQRYSRIGFCRYLYESLSFNFQAEIEVDELGLVVKYGDLWSTVS